MRGERERERGIEGGKEGQRDYKYLKLTFRIV